MRKPIVPFTNYEYKNIIVHSNVNPNEIVYNNRLDKRYLIEVRRVSPYKGELIIFDHEQHDKEVYSQQVSISYDAPFGPDVGDVAQWQEICAKFVDSI